MDCPENRIGGWNNPRLEKHCDSLSWVDSFVHVFFSFCFTGEEYENATAMVITLLFNNDKFNDTFLDMALAWEKKFIEFLSSYKSNNVTLFYKAEVGGLFIAK